MLSELVDGCRVGCYDDVDGTLTDVTLGTCCREASLIDVDMFNVSPLLGIFASIKKVYLGTCLHKRRLCRTA